jgi:hypothetical protein
MKRKLKTWSQFKEEFKPICDEWDKYIDGENYYIIYNDMSWYINSEMKKLFGIEIEVEEHKTPNYTHKDCQYGYHWYESWFEPVFEPIEFLNEEEMEI